LKVYVGNATRYQAGKIWDNFYGDMDDGTWRERFLKHLEALGYFGTETRRSTSMAALQGLLLASEGSMEGAIMMAEERLAAPELEGPKVEPLKPEPAKPSKVDPEVGVKKRARRQKSRFYVLSPLSSRRR
jgi:chaperone BCS1